MEFEDRARENSDEERTEPLPATPEEPQRDGWTPESRCAECGYEYPDHRMTPRCANA
jgi:hypothetical protein